MPQILRVIKKVENKHKKTHSPNVNSKTEDQQTYYGFDVDDFDQPPPDGRVLVLLQYP